MFFDFNVSYKNCAHDLLEEFYPKPGRSIELPQAVCFGKRAALVASHLINLPARIINTVVELAKAFFYALGVTFTFGQFDYFNKKMGFTALKTMLSAGSVGSATIGIFAPVNARTWEMKLADMMIDPDHHTMPTRAFIL